MCGSLRLIQAESAATARMTAIQRRYARIVGVPLRQRHTGQIVRQMCPIQRRARILIPNPVMITRAVALGKGDLKPEQAKVVSDLLDVGVRSNSERGLIFLRLRQGS